MTATAAPTTGTNLGYARVSTGHQSLDQQLDALSAAGVSPDRIYRDKLSGTSSREQRPGLAALLDYARPGDAIVVVGIDRLGRNAAEVMTTIRELRDRDIVFRAVPVEQGDVRPVPRAGVVSASFAYCSHRAGENGDIHRTGTCRSRVCHCAVEHVGFVAWAVHPPVDGSLRRRILRLILANTAPVVTRLVDALFHRRSIAVVVVIAPAVGGEVGRVPVGGGLQLGVLGEGVTRGLRLCPLLVNQAEECRVWVCRRGGGGAEQRPGQREDDRPDADCVAGLPTGQPAGDLHLWILLIWVGDWCRGPTRSWRRPTCCASVTRGRTSGDWRLAGKESQVPRSAQPRPAAG
jgi:hypothetical protein